MANKWAKIMAILGLTWILASIIWTWILFIIWNNTKEEVIETKNFDINKFAKENNLELKNKKTETWKVLEVSDIKVSDNSSGNTLSGDIEIETNSGTSEEKTNSWKVE